MSVLLIPKIMVYSSKRVTTTLTQTTVNAAEFIALYRETIEKTRYRYKYMHRERQTAIERDRQL